MTNKEFNKKWDDKAYNDMVANNGWDEYIKDCFDMYETEGFADTFESPYEEFKIYNGKRFHVIRRCNENDGFDFETLPMWEISIEDGFENEKIVYAFPEEICTIERI